MLGFGQLRKLEVLWIGKNMLEGVVSEAHFSNVTTLRLLQASGNRLSLKVSPDLGLSVAGIIDTTPN